MTSKEKGRRISQGKRAAATSRRRSEGSKRAWETRRRRAEERQHKAVQEGRAALAAAIKAGMVIPTEFERAITTAGEGLKEAFPDGVELPTVTLRKDDAGVHAMNVAKDEPNVRDLLQEIMALVGRIHRLIGSY